MKTNKKLHHLALALSAMILILIIVSSASSAATFKVGTREKYKTIQSAVDAAKNGDTIKVAYGTYEEYVLVNKRLTILGTNYPKIDGFDYEDGHGGGGTINGFSIQKFGVFASDSCKNSLIRNNYFYNCGISLEGSGSSGTTIMNNQLIGGWIHLYDTSGQIITGNTISKSECGLYVSTPASIPKVTKNTFKNCNYAVYLSGWDHNPGKLKTFSGNKYIGNKVNLGWGMDYP